MPLTDVVSREVEDPESRQRTEEVLWHCGQSVPGHGKFSDAAHVQGNIWQDHNLVAVQVQLPQAGEVAAVEAFREDLQPVELHPEDLQVRERLGRREKGADGVG